MRRDILIGIDAGTSVIKAVAFTLAGEQLAIASTPNDRPSSPASSLARTSMPSITPGCKVCGISV